MPSLRAYQAAMREARSLGFSVDVETAQRIAVALEEYAAELEAGLSELPPDQELAARESVAIVERAARSLEDRIAEAILHGVRVTVEDTLAVWQQASDEVGQVMGLPDSMMGAVARPELTQAQAFAALDPADTWRTLLRNHVQNAAEEATAIIQNALLRGDSPEAIARALRPYVTGAEVLGDAAAEVLDIASLPPELQGAAQQMDHNARRIAFSETHNARKVAEVSHFIADPLVALGQWTLSPNRGTQRTPDVCDALARVDWYGLGVGVFPLTRIPDMPHPWDRCEVIPIVRPLSELHLPKPEARLRLNPFEAPIPVAGLTANAEARVRLRLAELLLADGFGPAPLG